MLDLLAALALAALPAAAQEDDEVEIEIEADPAPEEEPVPALPPPPPEPDPRLTELETELATLTDRLASLEAVEARVAALEAPPPPPSVSRRWWEALDLRVSGYLQAQAEVHQLSEDEVSPDGRPLNLDRFLIRRGRLRVDRTWTYAHAALEIDANTVRGPFLSLRRAEATALLPHEDPERLPYAAVSFGLGEIPFGYELRWGNRERPWMERTTGSLAFFRGEPDVGVRGWGALGPVRYALAVQNGVPVDDRPGAVTEVFQRGKTVVGRLGLESHTDRRELGVGVSALTGAALHPGEPESKSALSWRDLNQDGIVALNELVAAPAQAATPSVPYRRWAVNADVQLGLATPLGWTRALAEITVATNLDRGLFVADPVATGHDLRELAWNVGLIQQVTDYGLVGIRVDHYDPNSDVFEQRRGTFVPVDASITTVSPLIAAQLPDRARLAFQYDWIADHLGRDVRGVPVDLRNDLWTLRLQTEF